MTIARMKRASTPVELATEEIADLMFAISSAVLSGTPN
jgi:hypothetical protein